MKRQPKLSVISAIVSLIIALSGFITLIIEGVTQPFLEKYPDLKLVIIMTSVILSYHVFLTFTIRSAIKSELADVNNTIDKVGMKVNVHKN